MHYTYIEERWKVNSYEFMFLTSTECYTLSHIHVPSKLSLTGSLNFKKEC